MTLHLHPFPPPDQANTFEQLCVALFRRLWNDEYAQLYGVPGQRQSGIDILGRPNNGNDIYAVQCKVRSGKAGRLTISEMVNDIQKAETHTPPIAHLIFATTARRHAPLQSQVLALTQERRTSGKFSISVMGWEDIQAELAPHTDIARLHFPHFFASEQHGLMGEVSGTSLSTSERSARLRVLLDLLNQGMTSNKLTVSEIAELLTLEKVSHLEAYFSGADEPPISLLKSMADLFNVSPEWLLHGKGAPFGRSKDFFPEAVEALELIRSTAPKEVYFVRSSSEQGECLIVLKYSEWRYLHLDTICNVSAHVGATGSSQLLSLFKLIKELTNPETALYCIGKTISPSDFDKLLNDESFPASILEKRRTSSSWWDALLDIHYKHSTAEKYKECYGPALVDAHRIIRDQIAKKAAWKTPSQVLTRM